MTTDSEKSESILTNRESASSTDTPPMCKNCGKRMQLASDFKRSKYWWQCTYRLRNNCNYTEELKDGKSELVREKDGEKSESSQECLPILTCDFVKQFISKSQSEKILIHADVTYEGDSKCKKKIVQETYRHNVVSQVSRSSVDCIFVDHKESDKDYDSKQEILRRSDDILKDEDKRYTLDDLQKANLRKNLENPDYFQYINRSHDQYLVEHKEEYDLVISDMSYLALGFEKDIFHINKMMSLLSDAGTAIVLVDPDFGRSTSDKDFIQTLSTNGYYLQALIDVEYADYIYDDVMLNSSFAIISRKKNDSVFIAKIHEGADTSVIIDNYLNGDSTEKLCTGDWVSLDAYAGFDKYENIQAIEKLQKNYTKYEKKYLKELVVKINEKRKIDISENAIYVPKNDDLGNVQISPSHLKDNVDYYQLICDENIMHVQYLLYYLKSEMGQKALRSAVTLAIDWSTSSNIDVILDSKDNLKDIVNIDYLKSLYIPVPPLDVQETIVDANRSIEELTNFLDENKNNLLLNPDMAGEVLNKVPGISEILNRYTVKSEISSLIERGQSPDLKFIEVTDEESKELLFNNVNTFVNRGNGKILVGVSMNGHIIGIQDESTTDDIVRELELKYSASVDFKKEQFSAEGLVLLLDCHASDSNGILDTINAIRKNKKFKIAFVGEFKKRDVQKELEKYFNTKSLESTAWEVVFINNKKLGEKGALKPLKKGGSFHLIITGQIKHHSSKGNSEANIITELKKEQYIDCISDNSPKKQLSAEEVVSELDRYLKEK